jgi:hypothetical protein
MPEPITRKGQVSVAWMRQPGMEYPKETLPSFLYQPYMTPAADLLYFTIAPDVHVVADFRVV